MVVYAVRLMEPVEGSSHFQRCVLELPVPVPGKLHGAVFINTGPGILSPSNKQNNSCFEQRFYLDLNEQLIL